jgi:hypothetical protein
MQTARSSLLISARLRLQRNTAENETIRRQASMDFGGSASHYRSLFRQGDLKAAPSTMNNAACIRPR